MLRLVVLAAGTLALAACGNTRELMARKGHSLPTAPYGVGFQPGPDALLQRSTQAAPQRNVELRTRSQEREDDPFDLPPQG
ncbi:hypothetical protein [Novosphingobium sp.]|uniref:hypothetical protein n=1 Tax=Novosphingobium sp. TaxID=1874826 RepID=UPI0025DFDEEA|nr:hypothetical protein [Novosphingobium sp.]